MCVKKKGDRGFFLKDRGFIFGDRSTSGGTHPCFTYVDTDNQLADIMTKILTMPAFRRHRAQCMSDMHVDDNNNHFNCS